MGRWVVRSALAGAGLCCVVAAQGPAAAQRAEDKAAAETLFREAKKLMRDGAFHAACSKFAASQRLDAQLGTLLNLADCNEKAGRTASAWAQFLEAATRSARTGNEARERVARKRAAALEPRLIRLAVTVPPEARVPGLTIHRDGVLIDQAAWDSHNPVDPGPHEIVATAPGKRGWRTTVKAEQEGDELSVAIPALEDAPEEAADADPSATEDPQPDPVPVPGPAPLDPLDEPTDGSAQRTAGIIIGGLGFMGIAIGSALGMSANAKWQDANCLDAICPDDAAQELSEKAHQTATIATISFATGVAVVLFGSAIYLTAPDGSQEQQPARALRVAPAVGPNSGSLTVFGRF